MVSFAIKTEQAKAQTLNATKFGLKCGTYVIH
jgi:hypothetical protein